jgi:amino acid efflux transporter
MFRAGAGTDSNEGTAHMDVTTREQPSELARHLTLPGAVSLAVTTVVGSGALVLPGIAYQKSGTSALWAWVISAATVVPLLVIFARLGAEFPGAGGVAGFIQAAFGRSAAAGAEVLLLGTLATGIPAVAMAGGHYLSALIGPWPGASSGAIFLTAVASCLNMMGIRLSSRVQSGLAIVLVVALFLAGAVGTFGSGVPARLPRVSTSSVKEGLSSAGIVFFAFTGWELLSFTTGEYRNPRRDVPRSIAVSFAIVTAVYLLLALGVQTSLDTSDGALTSAPVEAMAEKSLGNSAGLPVAALGTLSILATLVGALLGASRLVMFSAQESLLPRRLGKISLPSHIPRRAVACCFIVCTSVTILSGARAISLGSLLGIAGENFYILYLLSTAAYISLFKGKGTRIFGCLVLAGLASTTVTFGVRHIAYAAALFTGGWVLHKFRNHFGRLGIRSRDRQSG